MFISLNNIIWGKINLYYFTAASPKKNDLNVISLCFPAIHCFAVRFFWSPLVQVWWKDSVYLLFQIINKMLRTACTSVPGHCTGYLPHCVTSCHLSFTAHCLFLLTVCSPLRSHPIKVILHEFLNEGFGRYCIKYLAEIWHPWYLFHKWSSLIFKKW